MSRTFRRLLAAFLLLCASFSQSATVTSDSGLGAFAADWLDLLPSARSAALGGAFSAVSDDVDALVGNPAGLGDNTNSELSFTHGSWLQGVKVEQGRYARGLGRGRLAFGLAYIDEGKMDRIEIVDGQPVARGYLLTAAWIGEVGYGVSLGRGLSIGLGAKVFRESLDLDAQNGATGSAGFLWRPEQTDWHFGFAVVDVGKLGSYQTPWEARFGGAYDCTIVRRPEGKKGDRLALGVEVGRRFQGLSDKRVSLGAEYTYLGLLSARVGQQFAETKGLAGLNGFSTGVGVNILHGRLDYAYTAWGDMGRVQTLTFVATQ